MLSGRHRFALFLLIADAAGSFEDGGCDGYRVGRARTVAADIRCGYERQFDVSGLSLGNCKNWQNDSGLLVACTHFEVIRAGVNRPHIGIKIGQSGFVELLQCITGGIDVLRSILGMSAHTIVAAVFGDPIEIFRIIDMTDFLAVIVVKRILRILIDPELAGVKEEA